MSNQTTCPACHSLLRSETPLAPGTPIKCPTCQHIFHVGDVSAMPPGMPPVTAVPGTGPLLPGAIPPPRKRRTLRTVLLLVLGGSLGLCLCCCGPVFWFYFTTGDESLHGKWELDVAETKKLRGEQGPDEAGSASASGSALEKQTFTYEFMKKGFMRTAIFS